MRGQAHNTFEKGGGLMSHAGQSSSLIGTDGRRVRAGGCPCWQVWSVVRARNDYDMRGMGLSGYEGLLDDMVADRPNCEGGVRYLLGYIRYI